MLLVIMSRQDVYTQGAGFFKTVNAEMNGKIVRIIFLECCGKHNESCNDATNIFTMVRLL